MEKLFISQAGSLKGLGRGKDKRIKKCRVCTIGTPVGEPKKGKSAGKGKNESFPESSF